ncbi:MAG: alpha/beta hydrolase [Pseudobutyrivibrio ruminis]|uniref:Alpha/beta hydrolase n=1 Tax=Pseudobutyrivibrio ruminis TaxID=46206 RepID=A0A927YQV1_9FIRM|nr:alpha/beta hydrolase [Pseudobutyrivibrio ruminis]
MNKKLAVIFPGIGYHTDKPLLYYSKKLAKAKDYEVVEIKYDLPEPGSVIKADEEKRMEAFDNAFEQVTEQLKDIVFADYEKIVFIGKSIGSALAARYNMTYELEADQIILTPIETTFAYINPCEGFVFHGDADPLCDTDMCIQLCDELSLTYVVIPEANHSLETGEVSTDIENLGKVISMVDKLL